MWLSFCKENREKPLSFLCKTRSRKECFHIQSTRHTPLRRRRKKSFGVVVPPPRLPCLSNTFGGGGVLQKRSCCFLYCPTICRFFVRKLHSPASFFYTLYSILFQTQTETFSLPHRFISLKPTTIGPLFPRVKLNIVRGLHMFSQ